MPPGLNPTGIDWAEFTWNPIVGCDGGCSYCYARKMAARFHRGCEDCRTFTPHAHPERWDAPSKRIKPARIFVCSMGDPFDPKVKEEWIAAVYEAMGKAPQHTYMMLTKQPQGIPSYYEWPNLWQGVTVDKGGVQRIQELHRRKLTNKFVSFEPLLKPNRANLQGIDWVIVGGQTNPTIIPPTMWVHDIIDQCRDLKIPVFLKNNLNWPIKIQQYPGVNPTRRKT